MKASVNISRSVVPGENFTIGGEGKIYLITLADTAHMIIRQREWLITVSARDDEFAIFLDEAYHQAARRLKKEGGE